MNEQPTTTNEDIEIEPATKQMISKYPVLSILVILLAAIFVAIMLLLSNG